MDSENLRESDLALRKKWAISCDLSLFMAGAEGWERKSRLVNVAVSVLAGCALLL